jgi:two-component system response regulator AtoC
MAGSFVQPYPNEDVNLNSRLEGLTLLAQHLSEPVLIFSPDLKLVYANPHADRIAQECPLIERTQQEGLDPSHPILEPCDGCPGKHLLETSQCASNTLKENSIFDAAPLTCPLPRAVPLTNDSGQVGYLVMMGGTSRESQVFRKNKHFPLSDITQGASSDKKSHIPLIGDSTPMQQLIEMIKLVAGSEATVLIQGESGTGKELVAKTIHGLSPRRNHPFVVVECSSLPETLLESELFGHVQGAFTGATSNRKGLFQEAGGGTIFLDEIGDTSSIFQAKLLRVLQEGEIKPVGSSHSIKINVRVISACNRSLSAMMKNKVFRPDLYYRLAVLPLTIPPLRERREDIPSLVHHFLERSCQKHGRPKIKVAPDAMETLGLNPWPGNVRELENLIERVVVTTKKPCLGVSDLFIPTSDPTHPMDLPSVGKSALKEAERNKILETLQKTRGDKTKAARLLKISRASLYNKLKTYQIIR